MIYFLNTVEYSLNRNIKIRYQLFDIILYKLIFSKVHELSKWRVSCKWNPEVLKWKKEKISDYIKCVGAFEPSGTSKGKK